MTRRASISKNSKRKQLELAEARIVKRIAVFIGFVIFSFFFYHIDVFTGYWKLYALCKNEGGIKIYEPLRGNVGWMLGKSQRSPYFLSFIYRQQFVRYKDNSGNEIDIMKVLPPLPSRIYIKNYDPYIIIPADKKKTVVYLYKELFEHGYSRDKRFHKSQRLIIDIDTQKIVAKYTSFGFEWIKPFPHWGCTGEFSSFPTLNDFYTAVNSTME